MKVPVAATTKRTERPKVRRRFLGLGAFGGGGGGVDPDDPDDAVDAATGATGETLGATLMVEVVPAGSGVDESCDDGGGLRAVSLARSGFWRRSAWCVANCRWTGLAEARRER